MKGIILAAGRGSRMRHMTADKPKCMLKIFGKTLIEWQIFSMREGGLMDIGIVSGYKRETIKADYKFSEFYNPNWETTNMVSSLICANDWLSSFDCVVSYGDIFYSSTAIKTLINSNENISLIYDTNWKTIWAQRFSNPLDDAETFKLSENNFLTEIGKKTDSFEDISGQYMGLLKFTPEGWFAFKAAFKKHSHSISTTSLLNFMIEDSATRIRAYSYGDIWGEIDSISDLNLYKNLFSFNKKTKKFVKK